MIYNEKNIKIEFELIFTLTETVFKNFFDTTEKLIELIDDNIFLILKRK